VISAASQTENLKSISLKNPFLRESLSPPNRPAHKSCSGESEPGGANRLSVLDNGATPS
jgi:hypothetical protein